MTRQSIRRTAVVAAVLLLCGAAGVIVQARQDAVGDL